MKLRDESDFFKNPRESFGKLPDGWTVRALKSAGKFSGGNGFPHDFQGLSNEEIPFLKVNALSKAKNGYLFRQLDSISLKTALSLKAKIFSRGTIVFAKVGAALLLSRICRLGQSSCIDNNMMAYTLNTDNSADFFVYVLSQVRFDLLCNPGAVPSINEQQIGTFLVPYPKLKEQRQIAAYLNRETAKIDKLIAKQQKLIKLLQEKRQAVISKAVTKGLDPNVKMKDSGVEWLGDVPFSWTVTALKFVCDVRDGTHETPAYVEPSVNSRPLVTSKDISGGVLNLGTTKHISFEDFSLISRRSQVDCGDVLMPMIGTVGGAFIVENECDFSIKNIALFKKSTKVASKWLADYLDSNATRYQFDLNRSGGVQSFVSLGTLRNLIICVPPLDQQIEMVNKLFEVTTKIDRLIDKGATSIQLLKEHRQALITAAVTGKIDVRGLVTDEEVAALDQKPDETAFSDEEITDLENESADDELTA